jgi:hypothetical protein
MSQRRPTGVFALTTEFTERKSCCFRFGEFSTAHGARSPGGSGKGFGNECESNGWMTRSAFNAMMKRVATSVGVKMGAKRIMLRAQPAFSPAPRRVVV